MINPDTYMPDLAMTQANLGFFYTITNRIEKGIEALENCLIHNGILPDFGALCFAGFGSAYESLQDPERASQNYLFASATDFLMSNKGIPYLNDVLCHLEKVIELGNGTNVNDAQIIRTSILKLMGEDVAILDVPLSERGEVIKEALNGKNVELNPIDEIDLMVLILTKDLLS